MMNDCSRSRSGVYHSNITATFLDSILTFHPRRKMCVCVRCLCVSFLRGYCSYTWVFVHLCPVLLGARTDCDRGFPRVDSGFRHCFSLKLGTVYCAGPASRRNDSDTSASLSCRTHADYFTASVTLCCADRAREHGDVDEQRQGIQVEAIATCCAALDEHLQDADAHPPKVGSPREGLRRERQAFPSQRQEEGGEEIHGLHQNYELVLGYGHGAHVRSEVQRATRYSRTRVVHKIPRRSSYHFSMRKPL